MAKTKIEKVENPIAETFDDSSREKTDVKAPEKPNARPDPMIYRLATTILKAGIICFAIWAGWLALTVFSGLNEVMPSASGTDSQPIAVGTSVPTVGGNNETDDPESWLTKDQLDQIESIASIPVHQLLQGNWQMDSEGWSISFRSMGKTGDVVVGKILHAPPESEICLPVDGELKELWSLVEQLPSKVSTVGKYLVTEVKTDGIEAVVFSDAKRPDHVYVARAATRLSSNEPMLIEVIPTKAKADLATNKHTHESHSKFEHELYPDGSFIIADQSRSDVYMIVAPIAKSELPAYWATRGWNVQRALSNNAGVIDLRGVNEMVRIQFLGEEPGKSCSFIANRVIRQKKD